jgi:hypothetical protein
MLVAMQKSIATARAAATTASRWNATRLLSDTPFYMPTLTEKREGEAGRGGRSSEAGIKVALFGASGFLGSHVSAELGTYPNDVCLHTTSEFV